MQNECPAFHWRDHDTNGVFPSRKWNWTKCEHPYMRNFFLFVLDPLFSWTWTSEKSFFSPFPKINTAAPQCYLPSLSWLSTGVAIGHMGLTWQSWNFEATVLLWDFGKYLSDITALHPKRLESSTFNVFMTRRLDASLPVPCGYFAARHVSLADKLFGRSHFHYQF